MALVIGTLLPWVRTGGATRNSYTVVRTARTLELLDSSAATGALGLWFFVPALAALAVLALVLGRVRGAIALALLVAGSTVAFAIVVWAARVDTAVGLSVALVAAVGVVASSVGLVVVRRADASHPPADPD